MNEKKSNNKSFIGYEYKEITVERSLENLYVDSYENFGWELENISDTVLGTSTVNMEFKRDRKIINKPELTRLQRQFDSYANEILKTTKSVFSKAFTTAFTVGLLGTAFMASAVFSMNSNETTLCIILAIPAFICWILPYFLYKLTYHKKENEVSSFIESKYDEIYQICERANALLVH